MSADLGADTRVTPDPAIANRFHIALPDRWDYLEPSGGVTMACALRAAEAALGDARLRFSSATTVFCTPIHATDLVADVTVLRRGNATAQVSVALAHARPIEHGEGDLDNRGLVCTATFVRERKGPDVIGAAFPADVRPLADALPIDDGAPNNPHARFRFFQQLEIRIAHGERSWVPAEFTAGGPARFARWFRYRTPQRDADGRFDRLALPPLVDTMPTALHRAIGPGDYRFFAPSLDLTVYAIADTDREWLLADVRLKRAHRGVAICEVDVWDDRGVYVAHGAQAMYVQAVGGIPPIVDASGRT